MSAPTTPSSLHALLVFNPDLGEEATEARKLLYFFDNRPDTIHRINSGQVDYVDLNYQKDICGIAEGLIAFTRDFSPNSPCESVHCEQHRYAFAQPEKNYWMVLVVKNPTIITKEGKSTKDGGTGSMHTEYLEDELEDSVLQAILHRCYSLFSLFNSSFTSIVTASTHDSLRVKLGLFMSYFLPTIRFSQLIYFTDIHGFQFLPVDKITFLTIQYIIHLLTLNFQSPVSSSVLGVEGGGTIKNVAVMYNSKLIYSGLNSEIMFLLYSLDQDLMYFFLVDYLTLKENLHLDVQCYMNALAQRTATKQAAGVRDTTPAWMLRRPDPIAGMYNVPESVYERNGRLATNRKAWDRAQNKGELPDDAIFEPDLDDSPTTAAAATNGRSAGTQGAGGGLDEDNGQKDGRSNSYGSGSSSTNAPFGYMTGPYRVSANVTGSSANTVASLPGVQASSYAPCISSPLIYLDGADSLPHASGGGLRAARVGAYGSGNPGLESNPTFNVFPNAVDADSSSSGPLRLVVYQKYKITLFLIVEDAREERRGKYSLRGRDMNKSKQKERMSVMLSDVRQSDK